MERQSRDKNKLRPLSIKNIIKDSSKNGCLGEQEKKLPRKYKNEVNLSRKQHLEL